MMFRPFKGGDFFSNSKSSRFFSLVGCCWSNLPKVQRSMIFFLRSNKSNFDQWFNDVPGVNRRVPGFEWLSLVSCRWLTLKFLNP